MANSETSPRGGCTFPKPESLLGSLRDAADEVFSKMITTVAVLAACRGADERPADGPDDRGGKVDIEAVVEFLGSQSGAVVLRCSAAGALDIARGLLMLAEDEFVEVEEIEDALRECANIVSGCMKAKALDAIGKFTLQIPRIETYRNLETHQHYGTLVYRLAQGCVAIEIWLHDSDGVARH